MATLENTVEITSKVNDETTISDDFSETSSESTELPPPDFPAESFFVPKENEFDWLDRHAFYKRNESTKGNNSNNLDNSITTPSVSNLSSTISTSQRFSKVALFSLPKTQKPSYVTKRRHPNDKAGKNHFFIKRSRSNRNSQVPITEPTSPKVSCIGRVRSKRSRSRRNPSKNKTDAPKLEKKGFWSNLKAMLHLPHRRHGRKIQTVDTEDHSGFTKHSPSRASYASDSHWSTVSDSAAAAGPPGLGGLVRFASGRRTDTWVAATSDVDIGSLWHRREDGPAIKELDCNGRNWEAAGPTTV